MFSFYAVILDLIKARTHKYVRRIPVGATKTGATKYRYFYTNATASVQVKDEHLKQGASFAFGDGENRHHAHIVEAVGDKIKVKYDDGEHKGKIEEFTKDAFKEKFSKQHPLKERQAPSNTEKPKRKIKIDSLSTRAQKREVTTDNLVNVLEAVVKQGGIDALNKLLNQLKVSVTPSVDESKQNARLLLTGEAGKPVRHECKYKIIEASDLIASHKAESFGENPLYPKEVQERAYESDKAEQLKVIRNAQNLEPSFVVNTNPDAINGAPIMTPDRIVLGGNSRTMAIQRAYSNHPEKAQEYKEYLANNAHAFGFSSDHVASFKEPVLVREYEPSSQDKNNLRLLVRQMNEGFTQSMDERTETSAIARRLSDSTLRLLGAEMMASSDDNLADFLKSGSKGASNVINSLLRDGVLSNQNMNKYFDIDTQQVNNTFVSMLQNVITGSVLTDRKVIKKLKPSLYDRFSSGIITLVTHGLDEENKKALQSAIYAYALANSTGFVKTKGDAESNIRGLNDWFAQTSIAMGEQDEENNLKAAVRKSPLAKAYLESLAIGNSAEKIKSMYSRIAKRVLSDDAENQTDMFGEAPTTLEELTAINNQYRPKDKATGEAVKFISKSMRFNFTMFTKIFKK